ncbi:hypothetical protein [Phaeocystidibacter luteus]|uniref:MFS transporter n=1 Tax=Phaeocystidibacter luteus TaxID=911197 RepID=A0A6N6RIR6_9FLAO|nr:hypothetical protein [Phaeocystidibacter luteus]KAB2810268.1 hypothetical protein F8C67_06700 [Phaeocystidibacter luteus]
MKDNLAVLSQFGALTLQKAYYYGVRGVVIFLMIDTLNMENYEALQSYELLTETYLLTALPLGLLIDIVLGSKRAMSMGLLLQVLSGAMLSMGVYIDAALILMSAGSIVFLMGIHKDISLRSLSKKQRAVFSVLISGLISLGAAAGVLSIGMLGDLSNYGEAIQIALLLPILAFLLIVLKKKSVIPEQHQQLDATGILDHSLTTSSDKTKESSSWGRFVIMAIIGSCFWTMNEIYADFFDSFSTRDMIVTQSSMSILSAFLAAFVLYFANLSSRQVLKVSATISLITLVLGAIVGITQYPMSPMEYEAWGLLTGLAETAVFLGVFYFLWTDVPKKWVATATGSYFVASGVFVHLLAPLLN